MRAQCCGQMSIQWYATLDLVHTSDPGACGKPATNRTSKANTVIDERASMSLPVRVETTNTEDDTHPRLGKLDRTTREAATTHNTRLDFFTLVRQS